MTSTARWFKNGWTISSVTNTLSSIAYLVFGVIIIVAAIGDAISSSRAKKKTKQLIHSSPTFSLAMGASCVLLGLTAVMYHGTRSNFWKKLYYNMTNAAAVIPLIFSIFEKAAPPAASDAFLVGIGFVIQVS
jgi:uncharacterized membrane protein